MKLKLKFQFGRDKGSVIARLPSGKVAFPDKHGVQPCVGSVWECEVVKEFPKFAVLRLLHRVDQSEEEWREQFRREWEEKVRQMQAAGCSPQKENRCRFSFERCDRQCQGGDPIPIGRGVPANYGPAIGGMLHRPDKEV